MATQLNWKPVGNRIAVRPDKAPEKSEGGIYLPNAKDEKPTTGVVLLRGGEVANILPGDHVMFSKYAGIEIDMGGANGAAILLNIDEVLCHAATPKPGVTVGKVKVIRPIGKSSEPIV